jgi:hypothetical protein
MMMVAEVRLVFDQTFGFCLSEDQADTMKDKLPGLECDDDNTDDDRPR